MSRDVTKEESDAFFAMRDDEKIARAIVAACDASYSAGKKRGLKEGYRDGKAVFNHWAFLPVVITCIFATTFFVASLQIGLVVSGVKP